MFNSYCNADVQRDILTQLGLSDFGSGLGQCQLFHQGIDRPNLSLDVEEVWGVDEKLDRIQRTVQKWQATGKSCGIVYFTLIRTLLEFSEHLNRRGLEHVCYHGDLERRYRKRIQETFMTGRTPLVLATNAFGMGIDKEDIRFVIHADVPGSMEAYYQEIGRAGRGRKPIGVPAAVRSTRFGDADGVLFSGATQTRISIVARMTCCCMKRNRFARLVTIGCTNDFAIASDMTGGWTPC